MADRPIISSGGIIMTPDQTRFSVNEAASLCGVGRSTITYWIRNNKLYADRSGNSYSIPIEGLQLFLKSSGKEIPPELKRDGLRGPVFNTSRPCWEYWKGSDHCQRCPDCVVFVNHIDTCFTAKQSLKLHCGGSCHECRYYHEIYLPRIQFIHQIEFPATVFKDFYFWGGNRHWNELCDIPERELIGLGIEHVFHAESLAMVMANIKKRSLGDPAPISYRIFLKNKLQGKIAATIFVFPVNRMFGTFLVLAEIE